MIGTDAELLTSSVHRWKDKISLSTNKSREAREFLRSWMRASARRSTDRLTERVVTKARKRSICERDKRQGFTCSKPAHPKWLSRDGYALVNWEQLTLAEIEHKSLGSEINFQSKPAMQRWLEAAGPDTRLEEIWDYKGRASWRMRLAEWLNKTGPVFVNLEQLHKAAQTGRKVETWAMQTQRIPTITTTQTWGVMRSDEGGIPRIRRIDARIGLQLLGCTESSPLTKALACMTARAQMIAVGNGMQINIATGIARYALRLADVGSRRVRYADANSGIGFFAEAMRLATEDNMSYVFRAEASRVIARGHDAAWGEMNTVRFSSSHLQQDVDSMVALGQVDVWQISPACYPITRNNRKADGGRDKDKEEMIAQLASALSYVSRAKPNVVVIENVAEFAKGDVWQRVQHLLSGKYIWQLDIIDPTKHGDTAARERTWVVGKLRDHVKSGFAGTSLGGSGNDSCGH